MRAIKVAIIADKWNSAIFAFSNPHERPKKAFHCLNKSKKKTWHKPNELHSFKTNSICRTNYVTFITINDFIFKEKQTKNNI